MSPGNVDGQDEDPSVLVAADGALWVAWYSNRNGVQSDGRADREIFLTRTTDGVTWLDPVQVTRANGWAFYPSLAQDASGRFHIAWWQLDPLPQGCTVDVDCTGTFNTILYNVSDDGITWDLDAATTIANGPGDWLPTLVIDDATQRPAVYFTSPTRNAAGAIDLGDGRLRIYRVAYGGTSWSAPVRCSGLDAQGHNTYPHVVQRPDGAFAMTWTRYDAAAGTGVLDVLGQASADTLVAGSMDGVDWTAPRVVSDPTKLDVFPFAFDRDGDLRVVWLTAVPGASSGTTVDLAADGVFSSGLISHDEVAGYTARYQTTATPGITWAVWVSGAADKQKLWYRFFEAP